MSRPTIEEYQGSDTAQASRGEARRERTASSRRGVGGTHQAKSWAPGGPAVPGPVTRASDEVREEDRDLAHGRLGRVRSVDEVLGQLDRQVTADRTPRRLARVRRAHQRPHHLERAGTLHDQEQRRAARDERHEIVVERLALVLRIVTGGSPRVDRAQVGGDELQPLALQPSHDLADEPALDGVRLADDEGPVAHDRRTLPAGPRWYTTRAPDRDLCTNRAGQGWSTSACRAAPTT